MIVCIYRTNIIFLLLNKIVNNNNFMFDEFKLLHISKIKYLLNSAYLLNAYLRFERAHLSKTSASLGSLGTYHKPKPSHTKLSFGYHTTW